VSVIAGKSEMYTVLGVSGQCEHFLLLQVSLETRYRVQKCAGEWSVGSAQRGEELSIWAEFCVWRAAAL